MGQKAQDQASTQSFQRGSIYQSQEYRARISTRLRFDRLSSCQHPQPDRR